MSIKANILRDAMGNITVQMQGDLDYEHSTPLRDELNSLATDNPNSRITVDLGGIDFVGSSGICHFVETVQAIKSGISLTLIMMKQVIYKLVLEQRKELSKTKNSYEINLHK